MDTRRFTSSWLTRRGFLGTAAGATAYGLWWSLTDHAGIATAWAASDFKLRAPEPNPKYGGVLRYGIPSTPAHFDVHQSGTVNNMGTQGCMYDNLIRRDPRDSGQTIIPDLAHSWEISRDRKTYTFFLRKGVTFHDGAPFTADDVKATYARIVWPPRGVSIPRTPLFSTVSAIDVRDSHTIEFTLHEPRPENFMLAAFASGWNVIVRKKTLEDNNYDLRRVMTYPGTGPFRHVKCHQGGQAANGGRGLCQGHQGHRLYGQGRPPKQSVVGGHPGHAQGGAEHRHHPADCASLDMVR